MKDAPQAAPAFSLPNAVAGRNYLPHIDGLRCVAVIPVVIYHFLSGWCPAGFLGVDIFFVISGYLICGGIFKDLAQGRFSLTGFYHRRIRRIFPAYFVLVLVTLAVGVALYHWNRLIPLAQTALFSTLFSTNFYFWLDMGYFQPNAHGNPLLNLWSLGVEEHFYIVVPLATWLVWVVARKRVLAVYAAATVGSLLLCVFLAGHGQSTTAFYILPTRAWELLAGALLALAPPVRPRRWQHAASGLGLLLVLLSFWCLTTARTADRNGTSVELVLPFAGSLGLYPFPGMITVPVVLGSMLLIYYGATGPVSRMLGSGPFIGIGKISYSLYLWHWPILVFTGYITYNSGPSWATGLALALAFVAAYASWRWVEMPVRLSKKFTPRRAFTTAGAGCALLAGLCVLLISTSGLRNVAHAEANHFVGAPRPFLPNLEKFALKKTFSPPPYPGIDANFVVRIGAPDVPPSFILIGDSHAQALAPGLSRAAAEHGKSGYQVLIFMHPYVNDDTNSNPQRILRWAAGQSEIHDIYFLGRWPTQFEIEQGQAGLDDRGRIPEVTVTPALQAEIRRRFFKSAEWFSQHGKQVYFFTCIPDYLLAPNDIVARSKIIPTHHTIEISPQDYWNRQKPITTVFAELERARVARIIPLESAFIKGDKVEISAPDGTPWYSDGNHLTPEGAYHAVQTVAPLLWP